MNNILTAAPDVFTLLDQLNATISGWASSIKIPSMIFFIVGAVLALVIGLFGYRMIKLLLALSMGSIGYLAGVELAHFLSENIKGLPGFLSYVFGAILAIVLIVVSFKRFSYALYTVVTLIGMYLVSFYLGGAGWMLCLAGGLILALIATFVVRISFVLLTSVVGGILCVSFLGELLPNVTFLQLGTSIPAFFVALGAVVVLFVLQLLITRKRRKNNA